MPLPAWFDDGGKAERKKRNKRSQKQETARAKEIGGRPSRGSGSSYRDPQDVSNKHYMEQLKFTDKKSFTVKESEWESLERDALRAGKEPRYVVEAFGRRFLIVEG